MGSGASSQVHESLQGRSTEELTEALKDLTPESYQKVADAVILLEGGSAPFLKKAFENVNEVYRLLLEAEMTGEAAEEKLLEQLDAEYNTNLKKSFQYHDKDSSGKLDKEQAAAFFSHLLSEGSGFMHAMSAGLVKHTMKQTTRGFTEGLVAAVGKINASKLLPGALKLVEAEMKKFEASCHEKTAKLRAYYMANKENLDMAALKLTDTDGSGSLNHDEFIAMMDFGEPLNLKLLGTLGLSVDPEVMAQSIDIGDIERLMGEYMTKLIMESEEKAARELASDLKPPHDADESSAPFLKKAFETLMSMYKMTMDFYNPMSEGQQDQLDKEYKAYLIRSFQHHDKDSTKKLDRERAALFFSNLLSEACPFMDAMCDGIVKHVMDVMRERLAEALVVTVGRDSVFKFLPGALKLVENDLQKFEATVRDNIRKLKADYLKNKAEKDAAALKVADLDGTGCLSETEFIAMMEPNSEQNIKLMECLGITMDIGVLSANMEHVCFADLEKQMEEYMQKMTTESLPEERRL